MNNKRSFINLIESLAKLYWVCGVSLQCTFFMRTVIKQNIINTSLYVHNCIQHKNIFKVTVPPIKTAKEKN